MLEKADNLDFPLGKPLSMGIQASFSSKSKPDEIGPEEVVK
jgi:hypothetical protein